MSGWSRLRWWVSKGLRPERSRSEVEADINVHIDLATEHLISKGLSPQAARERAEAQFGSRSAARRAMRRELPDLASTEGLEQAFGGWLQGARRALRKRGETALLAGALGSAIALATVATSIATAALKGPGGVRDADRVVSIFATYDELPFGMQEQPIHPLEYLRFPDSTVVEAMAAFKSATVNLTGRGDPQRLDAQLTTPDLFRVAGTPPTLGAGFQAGDEQLKVVVISWALWQNAFEGDPGILGKTARLNDEAHEIVGVMPRDFRFPRAEDVPPSFKFASRPDLWLPYELPTGGPSDLAVVARLRPGVPLGALDAHLSGVLAALSERFGQVMPYHYSSVLVRDQALGGILPGLIMVLIATGLMVVVGLANVAGIGLVRSEARVQEFSVRMLLGANRRHAGFVLLGEGAVVGGLATLVGLGAGGALTEAVRLMSPPGVPGVAEATWTGAPLAVAVLIGMAGSIALALGPWIRTRTARTSGVPARRGASSGWVRRAGRVVVAGELGLTLVLIFSASLLYTTMNNLLAVEVGFDPDQVLTAQLTLPEASYPDRDRASRVQSAGGPASSDPAAPAFYRQLTELLRQSPGVLEAGAVTPLPFSGTQEATVYWIEGSEADAQTPFVEYTVASQGYIEAMGSRLLEGRAFEASDTYDSEPVVVVSATLAGLFPDGQALGRRMKLGGAPQAPYPWMTVVGVVDDVRRGSLMEDPRGEMYVPMSQGGYTSLSTMHIVVRADEKLAAAALGPILRSAVREIDPNIPLDEVRGMVSVVGDAAGEARFIARMMVAFAAISLVVTVLGFYSTVTFSVAARARELAIRSAVGASPARATGAILSDSFVAAAWGTALAVVGIVAARSLLDRLVFGVEPTDLGSLALAAGLMAVTLMLGIARPIGGMMSMQLSTLLKEDC